MLTITKGDRIQSRIHKFGIFPFLWYTLSSMKNITKLFAWFVPAFLFIFLSASPAKAVFLKSGDNVSLPKTQKISEAAVVYGSTLVIDSDIDGDLYCAGRDVTLNGNVKGDVICAAQSFKINGTVDGNIRALAQTIDIAGSITRNLSAASQSLIIEPKSQIKGDLFFGAQNVNLNGVMGRDLAGAGETITVSGSLIRNALITSTDLSVANTGKIGGNLDYYMEKSAVATIGAKAVKGSVVRHEIATPEKTVNKEQVRKTAGIAMTMAKIFGVLAFVLLGLVLIYFDRRNTEARVSQIISKPLVSGLLGFAVLFLFPFAFFIMVITIVGIPLAFVVLLVYVVALVTASLYTSIVYGKLLLEKLFHNSKATLALQMLLGVVLLGLVTCLPIIGWLIGFVSFCLGLGAIVLTIMPQKV